MQQITRNDLKNYQKMKILLSDLDEEIEYAYNTYKSPSLSSDGSGRSLSANSPVERALRHIKRLDDKRSEILSKISACNDFVDSIDDYLVQAICRDHYLKGYTWEATCLHLRKHSSTSVVIEMANKYFDKVGLK